MTDHPMNDDDIASLFDVTPELGDADAFEGLVMGRLHTKLWLRRGLLTLAGLAGIVIAVVQFMRMPWRLGRAEAETGQTVRGVFDFMHAINMDIITTVGVPQHYADIVQAPIFFLLSFSLCLAVLGLYYAYTTEETL